jgi:hypothetical protein
MTRYKTLGMPLLTFAFLAAAAIALALTLEGCGAVDAERGWDGAALSVWVATPDGAPVEGARVEVAGQVAETDAVGFARLVGLEVGLVALEVAVLGEPVRVLLADTSDGEETEEVVVGDGRIKPPRDDEPRVTAKEAPNVGVGPNDLSLP